jgi:tripartite-type tricarboxylate transporter receptor subunit TctC
VGRPRRAGRNAGADRDETQRRAAQRIDSPDVQAKFKTIGFEGFSSTPEELGAFIKVQLGVWGKMIKDAGINPD